MRATWTAVAALALVACSSSPKTTGGASLSVSVASASADAGLATITVTATDNSGNNGTGTVHLASDYGSLASTGTNVASVTLVKGTATATLDCTADASKCRAPKVRVIAAWEGLEANSGTGGGELPAAGSSGTGGTSGGPGTPVTWADCSQGSGIVKLASEFGQEQILAVPTITSQSAVLNGTIIPGKFVSVGLSFTLPDAGTVGVLLQSPDPDGGSIAIGTDYSSASRVVTVDENAEALPLDGPVGVAPCYQSVPVSWTPQELVGSGTTVTSFGASFSISCADGSTLTGCVRTSGP